jgi:hypothetical protein
MEATRGVFWLIIIERSMFAFSSEVWLTAKCFLFCFEALFLLASLLAAVRWTSRWATPMKAIIMTVFLFKLGIRFAKSPSQYVVV